MKRIYLGLFTLLLSLNVNAQVNLVWQNPHPNISSGEESRFIISDFQDNIFTMGEKGTITKFNTRGALLI